MKTVSLELAKTLKEKGFPQKGSTFYWEVSTPEATHLTKKQIRLAWNDDIAVSADYSYGTAHLWQNDFWDSYAAPTADEILDLLPWSFRPPQDNMYEIEIWNTGEWAINYKNRYDGSTMLLKEAIFDKVLANAAAKIWLYLKENKLL